MYGIIEQLAPQVVDAIDVLTKVDQFYHNAWLKLLYVVGIGGFIIGVIVPLVVQRIQQASFKSAETRFEAELDKVKGEYVEDLRRVSAEAQDQLNKTVTDLVQRTTKRIRGSSGNFYGFLAMILPDTVVGPAARVLLYIFSAYEFASAEADSMLEMALDYAVTQADSALNMTSDDAVNVGDTTRLFAMSKDILTGLESQIDEIELMIKKGNLQQGHLVRLRSLREKMRKIFA